MKTIVSCLILAMTFSYLSTAEESKNVAASSKDSPSVETKKGKKIILLTTEEVSDADMIETVQDKYIKNLHPDHRAILRIGFLEDNGRYIEHVACINKGAEDMVHVNFDMTNVYKHFKQKDEQSRKVIEKREEMYLKMVK